ncbi:MAG: AGE family epimerase/isomerase [Kineosporiaceae bacterium]|nr:AGE family epimerase/isomerase [Aeromicrobium sp.]
MTYVFSLAFLAGEGDCTEFAAHGVEALSTLFHDDDDNGWSAEGFFERAVSDGVRDGLPGICYTPDWAGKPVVAERFQWVMAEAILAADALAKATGEERYRGFADRWWQEVNTHFADPHDRQLASRIVTDNGGV